MIRSFIASAVASIILVSSCQHYYKREQHAQSAPFEQALQYAKEHLSHDGVLVQQSDGYAYIKVDDDYIHRLYPLLNTSTYEKPPYFRRKDAPGAHISVVYEDEHQQLDEAGKHFTFTLKNIVEVHPKKGLSYIVLQVSSPELENLRKKYGLSPLLKGHEFHITLAKIKPRS